MASILTPYKVNMMKEEEEAINISEDEEEVIGAEPGCVPTGNTPFDVQVALNMEALRSSETDSWNHINRRLNKFFQYSKKMRPGEEYFKPKWEPDYSDPDSHSLPNTILIYGIDFIRLKVLGKQLPEHQRKLINESNCLFIFPTDDQAWAGLKTLLLDPGELAHKQEQDGQVVPRSWFELKPYLFKHREVKMWARFAASSDFKERKQEGNLNVYIDSRQIFNEQEEERQRRGAERQDLFNERRAINKSKNTERLYNQYQNENGVQWKEGIDNNPGAHRERSRSRSKERQSEREDRADVVSNSSFILTKRAEQLEKQMGDIQLSEINHVAEEGVKSSQGMKPAENRQGKAYNWEGSQAGENREEEGKQHVAPAYRFSYQEYIRQQQEEEERQRSLVQVIELDD